MAAKKLGQPTLDDVTWARALRVLKNHVGKDKDINSKELAALIDVSGASVSAWINNKGRPTLPNLIAALRVVGEDPAKILPEVFRSEEMSVSDLHARLVNASKFLALESDLLITAWEHSQRSFRTEWVRVWEGLPDFIRQAAMGAVYLWGYPIEDVCEAAKKAWESASPADRKKNGEHPALWIQIMLTTLPPRPGSGIFMSKHVGDVSGLG